jgi:hypothetical protein
VSNPAGGPSLGHVGEIGISLSNPRRRARRVVAYLVGGSGSPHSIFRAYCSWESLSASFGT